MSTTAPVGFLRPTTTPTPDELFDVWLPVLSGAALKVLLYIVRRTLGFKKDADAISLSQICRGITTTDGRILDQGTGLARNTAIKAAKELVDLGLIVVEHTQDERGVHEVNTYRLRFRDCDVDEDNTDEEVVPKQDQGSAKSEPGVVRQSHHGSSKRQPRVGRKTNPQQTVIQETVVQETEQPLPPANTLPKPILRNDASSTGAGGAAMDSVYQPLEPAYPLQKPDDEPGKPSTPDPIEQEQACQRLVRFGMWEKDARRLVSSRNMTSEFASQACAALQTESEQGKHFDNLAAVLRYRLDQGWVPPEMEVPIEQEKVPGLEDGESFTELQSKRKTLPPVVDSRVQEYDAYTWFNALREEIRLTIPRETFDAWLRGAELADISCVGPPKDNEMPTLTIQLPNRYAYEWVSQRLHKNIQRIADTMLGYHVSLFYTAPHLEQTGHLS